MDKKVWQKPELIVLVRSKPEEAVLTACKLSTSPNRTSAGCKAGNGPCGVSAAGTS
jgi:hypothetical protein